MKTKLLVAVLVFAVAAMSIPAIFADEAKCDFASMIGELNLTADQQSSLMAIMGESMQIAAPYVEAIKNGDESAAIDLAFNIFESIDKGWNILDADQKAKAKAVIKEKIKSCDEISKKYAELAPKLGIFVTDDGIIKPEVLTEGMKFVSVLNLSEAQVSDYSLMFGEFMAANASKLAAAKNGDLDSAIDAGFASIEFIGSAYNKLTDEQKLQAKVIIKSDEKVSNAIKNLLMMKNCEKAN